MRSFWLISIPTFVTWPPILPVGVPALTRSLDVDTLKPQEEPVVDGPTGMPVSVRVYVEAGKKKGVGIDKVRTRVFSPVAEGAKRVSVGVLDIPGVFPGTKKPGG